MQSEQYKSLSETELKWVMSVFEKFYEDGDLELDYADGVIQIEIEGTGIFVINKHDASQQMWVSSPISGAYRFTYDGNSKWEARGEEFRNLLKREIEQSVRK